MRPELIIVKVFCLAGTLWVSSADPVATKILLERNEKRGKQDCYILLHRSIKETRQGYRKEMYGLWIEMGVSEIEDQHFACQVCSIFNNKRLTEIKIQ